MKTTLRFLYAACGIAALLASAGVLATVLAYLYVAPDLPGVAALRDMQLQVPLRVYSRDGRLVAEFGEKRRIPVSYENIPETVVKAFLAAEDDRFFEHPGVDYQGLVRAAVSLLLTGEKRQGGGTITMQVARNFFLTPEKTIVRKVREIFLALRIERELDKQEILTLYLNKIFLGQRAYGVGAAAEVYYGKTLHELTVAEVATIAGLPKAPSRDNPVSSPDRALERRAYVLRRMHELGYIGDGAHQEALRAPIETYAHSATMEVQAPYVAEMVRADMLERFGPDAYTAGYRVRTTIDSRLQEAAVAALRSAVIEYDRRHGYRGPLAQLEWPQPDDEVSWSEALAAYPVVAGLVPGLVVEVAERGAGVWLREGRVELDWQALEWARPYVDDDRVGDPPETAADVVAPGDLVYLRFANEQPQGRWELTQLPQVQAALVALDPQDGAIVALSGGFEYFASKFNRATQAARQPGSAFKPFVYSAALEHGFTPASLVNDAPVVYEDAALENTWRPENYSRRFHGPTRLREALVRSRNLVSIRVLRTIGVRAAVDHIRRFGFDEQILPRDLSLALGSAAIAPVQLASGYATFANGGFSVRPYYIERIEHADGEVVEQADPPLACAECKEGLAEQEQEEFFSAGMDDAEAGAPGESEGTGIAGDAIDWDYLLSSTDPAAVAERVISPQNAFLITNMMQDVVRRGTGRRAMELERNDLAGKTGTTNDLRDAWFSGFNADLVATTWIGFDQERPLGRGEVGGRAALPMWMHFMRAALHGVPERDMVQPGGLVTVRISPESGLLAGATDSQAIFETFRIGHVPPPAIAQPVDFLAPEDQPEEEDEPLF